MFRFLIGRLLQGLLVLFALYTITFFLAKAMPGEPFTSEKNVSAETKANIRKLYGLDKPLWEQYYVYPKNIITEGSFGVSTSKGRPVGDIIAQSFPNSLLLGLCALCFAVGIGVPIGVLSAVRRNSWVDWTCMAVAMVGICVPSFTIGPLLQIYFAAHVPGLKVAGWGESAGRSLACLYARSRFSGIPRATHPRRHSGSPFAGLRAHRVGPRACLLPRS